MGQIRRSIGVVLAGVLALLAVVPAVHAQGGDQADWTALYRPALLPGFVGDMARHASAPRYDLDLTIAPGETETHVTGEARITVTNRHAAPLDTLVFRLYPNLPSYGGEMDVRAVTVDGAPVEPGLDDTRSVLTVPLPEPLMPGAAVRAGITYTITVLHDSFRLYGQFGYLDGVLALPNAYPMLAVYQPGEGWWQVTAHPQGDVVFSETAFFDVRVTAPPDLIFAATGTEIDLAANADGTLTHRYVAPLVRDFSLAGNRRYVTLTGEQDGVLLRLFYDPAPEGAGEAAQRGLGIARAALATFGVLFGPYPFAELDVVQTPNAAGGLEYPGLIAINDEAWNTDPEYFEFLLVHEIAHQWWYSLVGNDHALEPWLDEALSTYSERLFYENNYPANISWWWQFRVDYFKPTGYVDTNIYNGGSFRAYTNAVYFRGARFLDEMRVLMGHGNFSKFLKEYITRYAYGHATSADFFALAREIVNVNYNNLLGKYFFGSY